MAMVFYLFIYLLIYLFIYDLFIITIGWSISYVSSCFNKWLVKASQTISILLFIPQTIPIISPNTLAGLAPCLLVKSFTVNPQESLYVTIFD